MDPKKKVRKVAHAERGAWVKPEVKRFSAGKAEISTSNQPDGLNNAS